MVVGVPVSRRLPGEGRSLAREQVTCDRSGDGDCDVSLDAEQVGCVTIVHRPPQSIPARNSHQLDVDSKATARMSETAVDDVGYAQGSTRVHEVCCAAVAPRAAPTWLHSFRTSVLPALPRLPAARAPPPHAPRAGGETAPGARPPPTPPPAARTRRPPPRTPSRGSSRASRSATSAPPR